MTVCGSGAAEEVEREISHVSLEFTLAELATSEVI